MYDVHARRHAVDLVAAGRSLHSVSRELGISRAALRDWRVCLEPRRMVATCVRCQAPCALPPTSAYAHLLGLYLGDGCLSRLRKDFFSLRISCCDRYPRLIDECVASTQVVRPGKVFLTAKQGCVDVTSSWKHWPCLFPQHGRGRKRPIVLEPWQAEIVTAQPGRFLRGLFHSDGCRIVNWTTKTVAGQVERYEYPRYFFVNRSPDILGLCSWALGLLAIEHRFSTLESISVAKKAAVAALDEHVGPKA
jgi:hypothetical protein